MRIASWPLVLLCFASAAVEAQSLPSIPTLLADVQANQRALDKTRESYTFREIQVVHELDKHGGVRKQEMREYNVFYVNGHPIQRLVRKDGAALTSDEEKKETAHMENKVQMAEKTSPGDPLNTRHQVSIGRLLTLEHLSGERRVTMDNRPMIALDFIGDPNAQTHGLAEDASKHLTGTLWIDERDHQVRRVEARLDSPFRLELGLASLTPGSNFTFDQKIINNEVWLPTGATVHIEARAALFLGYHIQVQITDDQYRKFQTNSEMGADPAVKR